jgi:hypothetical protein
VNLKFTFKRTVGFRTYNSGMSYYKLQVALVSNRRRMPSFGNLIPKHILYPVIVCYYK